MRVSRRTLFQLSLGGSVAACWPPTPYAQAGSLTPVTCLFPFQTFGAEWAFYFAAESLGYFRDEGLDVAAQPTKGSPEVGRLLAAGQGDIGFAGAEATLMNVGKGLPLRDVFTVQQGVIYRVGVPEKSAIKAVADLKGKRIGCQSLTGSTVFMVKVLARDAGLDPERDITFVPIGLGGQALGAIRAGEVDAAAYGDTTFVEFAQNGIPFRYFPSDAFRGHFGVGIVVPATSVESRGDMITRFSRALAKGLVFSFENPGATIRHMQKVVPGFAENDFEGAVARLKVRQAALVLPTEANGVWGWNTPERYDAYAKFLLSVGFMSEKVNGREVIDQRFVAMANAFDPKPVVAAARSP